MPVSNPTSPTFVASAIAVVNCRDNCAVGTLGQHAGPVIVWKKRRQPMLWNRGCRTPWQLDCDPSQGEYSCKANRKDTMLNVLLYTTQPVLVLGLGAALEESDCRLAKIG